jgi:hypothetical protein
MLIEFDRYVNVAASRAHKYPIFSNYRKRGSMNHSIEQIKLSFNHLNTSVIVVAMLAVSVLLVSYSMSRARKDPSYAPLVFELLRSHSMGGMKGLAPGAVAQESTSFDIKVSPANPRTIDPISIKISGIWRDSCTPTNPEVRIDGKQIYITTSNTDKNCLTMLTPWSNTTNIGMLPIGNYQILVSHISNAGQEPLGSAEFEVFPCFNCLK